MPMTDGSTPSDDWDSHWEDYQRAVAVSPAQEYRRQLILASLRLDDALSPRLLDIGSGLGDFLIDVHARYRGVPKLGLESSQTGVDIATRRCPDITFLRRDLLAGGADPAEHRGFATHAVCSEVLEHVDDPSRLLANARPYLAEGCRLVVTVPGGPRSAYDRHIGHRRHFTPAELRQVLTQAGFTVDHATGAGFPFFNLYRVLVILAGRQLTRGAKGKPGASVKLVAAVFRVLFKLNSSASAVGWQVLAVART
jgi:SAM-dependent methyltransferase